VSSPAAVTPLSEILDFYPHLPGPLPGGEILRPRSDFFLHPPVLYREGWSIVRGRTFLITPLSSTKGVVLCPKLDFFRHLPGPLPGGEILCPRSDFFRHPPVLYQEGWSIVRGRTFLLTSLVFYQEGRSFVRDRTFSSPPCPLPRGVVLCPISDFLRGYYSSPDFLTRLLLLSRFFNEVITPLPIF
jgi:hypothetical protein